MRRERRLTAKFPDNKVKIAAESGIEAILGANDAGAPKKRGRAGSGLGGAELLFVTAGPIAKLFAWGRGEWRTCAMRYAHA
jgi:hypothetical protein